MPIVGLLTARMDPRKLLASGFALTALTLFWFANLNLDAGYWDLFWPQFLQGVSLGLLFVPLTTISMDPIPKERMGNATSLFNLTRNVGASVGIAVVQTILARHRQIHTRLLGEHVNPFNPVAREMLSRLQSAFEARGADAATASREALAVVWGMVQRQAAVQSFLDVFRLLGILVLCMIPLVLLMRRPRSAGEGVMAAE
jgi:DHA2 family multidrug resistance protein